MLNPSLPRKPLGSLTFGQAREKVVLNAELEEISMHGKKMYLKEKLAFFII